MRLLLALDEFVIRLGPDMQEFVEFELIKSHDSETEIRGEPTLLRGGNAKLEAGMEYRSGETARIPGPNGRFGREDHRRAAIEPGIVPKIPPIILEKSIHLRLMDLDRRHHLAGRARFELIFFERLCFRARRIFPHRCSKTIPTRRSCNRMGCDARHTRDASQSPAVSIGRRNT